MDFYHNVHQVVGAKIESRVLNQLLQHLPETPAMSGYSSDLNMPTTPRFTNNA